MQKATQAADIAEIRMAATEFRDAIDFLAPTLGVTFRNFPLGACGDATPLLGRYLMDRRLGRFQFMIGRRWNSSTEVWNSHAWLQRDDLVIDITADQFGDMSESVLVLRNSSWHELFSGREVGDAGFEMAEHQPNAVLPQMYNEILRRIAFVRATESVAKQSVSHRGLNMLRGIRARFAHWFH